MVENILGDFEYEVQLPYLLYRNAFQEVNRIWFYNAHKCEEVANLFSRILDAYSKVPTKSKVSSVESEIEELEAVPTLAVMDGPLEPTSSIENTGRTTSQRSTDLVKLSTFFGPPPSSAGLVIPPVSSSSSMPTAPPLNPSENLQCEGTTDASTSHQPSPPTFTVFIPGEMVTEEANHHNDVVPVDLPAPEAYAERGASSRADGFQPTHPPRTGGYGKAAMKQGFSPGC